MDDPRVDLEGQPDRRIQPDKPKRAVSLAVFFITRIA
jgi:hypothetical protein